MHTSAPLRSETYRAEEIDSTTLDLDSKTLDGQSGKPPSRHTFSVAPMMEYTDTHQRFLMRMISKRAVLYTEMIAANALTRVENPERYLIADLPIEEPLVLQLGGSDVEQIREATKLATSYGYREININCGCPSAKVAGAGCFGASLMLNPDLVAKIAEAVNAESARPATIKCRIGVNERESYEDLSRFVDAVSRKGGVSHFIIHARKAVLDAKFSPHDNRSIPPLKYDYVYRLAKDFPHLSFTLNGGVLTYEEIQGHIEKGAYGVMVGRSVVDDPFYWRNIDSKLYKENDPGLSRRHILTEYAAYANSVEKRVGPKCRSTMIKPILTLFKGEPNGRLFRTFVGDNYIRDKGMSIGDVILTSMGCLSDETLDKV